MGTMPRAGWTLTDDRRHYAETVLPLLRADPIGNTVILGVTSRLGDDPRAPRPEDCYGWWTDESGAVAAAILAHPPHAVALCAGMPGPAAEQLPGAWTESGRPRPAGVFGPVATADAIAAAWAARTGGGYRPRPRHSMRLFEFAEPAPPDPAPSGGHRLATPGDLDLVVRWERDFHDFCGIPAPEELEAFAEGRIAEGRTVLWVAGGVPTAMACYSPVVEASSRITDVYTPPEHRRRGYAAGVTWATTALAQEAGAAHVLLHTDLSNPTSNAVYQRLGYRPVHDVTEFEFTG
jgi:GNAT superfamily N-acetyltransferase